VCPFTDNENKTSNLGYVYSNWLGIPATLWSVKGITFVFKITLADVDHFNDSFILRSNELQRMLEY